MRADEDYIQEWLAERHQSYRDVAMNWMEERRKQRIVSQQQTMSAPAPASLPAGFGLHGVSGHQTWPVPIPDLGTPTKHVQFSGISPSPVSTAAGPAFSAETSLDPLVPFPLLRRPTGLPQLEPVLVYRDNGRLYDASGREMFTTSHRNYAEVQHPNDVQDQSGATTPAREPLKTMTSFERKRPPRAQNVNKIPSRRDGRLNAPPGSPAPGWSSPYMQGSLEENKENDGEKW